MTVFFDCTDLLSSDDFKNSKADIYAHVTNVAKDAAAYGFSPSKLAIGPVNEWEGDDGAGGDPFAQHRQDLHGILRAALPGFVLTASSDYWDYYKNLEALSPLADQRVIYSFHSYEAHDATAWASDVLGPLTAWSRQHGRLPVLWGEAGPGNGYMSNDSSNPAAYPANMEAMVPAMAVFRPTFWAITYGNAWPFNKSASDATLLDGSNGSPNLEAAVKNAAAAAAANLAGNDGAP